MYERITIFKICVRLYTSHYNFNLIEVISTTIVPVQQIKHTIFNGNTNKQDQLVRGYNLRGDFDYETWEIIILIIQTRIFIQCHNYRLTVLYGVLY